MSSLTIIMNIEYDMHALRNQNTVMRSLEVYFHQFLERSPHRLLPSFISLQSTDGMNTFSFVVGAWTRKEKSISLWPYEMRINCYRFLGKINTHRNEHRSTLHEFTLMRLLCARFVWRTRSHAENVSYFPRGNRLIYTHVSGFFGTKSNLIILITQQMECNNINDEW